MERSWYRGGGANEILVKRYLLHVRHSQGISPDLVGKVGEFHFLNWVGTLDGWVWVAVFERLSGFVKHKNSINTGFNDLFTTTWMTQFQNVEPSWILLQQEMKEVAVVTTGTLKCAQSGHPPPAYQYMLNALLLTNSVKALKVCYTHVEQLKLWRCCYKVDRKVRATFEELLWNKNCTTVVRNKWKIS